MNDQEIKELIEIPKVIEELQPKVLKIESGHQRQKIILKSMDNQKRFWIFVRRNLKFVENFSVGLVYSAPDGKNIHLLRLNGAHGQVSKKPFGLDPHIDFHIHTLTSNDFESGNYNKPSGIELTNEFVSLEQATAKMFIKANILNGRDFFSNLDQLNLFN
ncbi:MAG: hypothetical protein WC957_02795 [Candidatus Neomarinimicrobiota bacterium]|jgi:hypothetical protein